MEKILIDNELVRVTEVTIQANELHTPEPRGNRVIINLSDSHIKRQHHGKAEAHVHQKPRGSVIYREASSHSIQNVSEEPHHSIVVELK